MEKEQKTLIERWGGIAAAITAILSLVFLVFPTLRPASSAPTPSDSPPDRDYREARTSTREDPGDVILGSWQQYIPDQATGAWQHVGTFVVTKSEGSYVMSAREQRSAPDMVNSIGIFAVQSDGNTWSFNSNWGEGRVGNFLLERVSNTSFEGTIQADGSEVTRTRWTRTQ